ncbi:MAG: hypothetical protein M3256_02825 [Actinomycetota bacterium]|nr:hypothetical protein [Actinomycetota bacterium]
MILAASALVVALLVAFAILLFQRERRIRYQLNNRLTPLRVGLVDSSPPRRWLPAAILAAAVVAPLVVLALTGR